MCSSSGLTARYIYSPPVSEEVAVEGMDAAAGAVEPGGIAEAAEISGMEPTGIGVAGSSSARRVALALSAE